MKADNSVLAPVGDDAAEFRASPSRLPPSEECSLDLVKTADPNLIVPGPTPGCDGTKENKIAIASLTLKYTEDGCVDPLANPQGGKADCSGSIDPMEDVSVTAAGGKDANKTYPVDPTTVAPEGEFTITPADGKDGPKDKLEAESTIELTNVGGMETIEIHTSCSQPLQVGNVFGNLTVTDITLIPK